MIQSVYIHIPFCHEICHYCDFTKNYYNESQADQYLDALKKEMELYIGTEKKQVKTIYIGGGTPTSLSDAQFQRLLSIVNDYFDVGQATEFTIEANPGEFSSEKAKMLRNYGANRISLGVQVLDDEFLKMLNRNHQVRDVEETVAKLQANNLSNISMDFIYALPGQSIEHFERTLNSALAYQLPHYSAYALQIEPKTVFYMRYQKGKLSKPPEEDEAEMYELLVSKMEQNGLHHYEVSNFGKPGFESQHNLTYWDNEYYFGFGAGAHGYLQGKRIVNLRPINHYIERLKGNEKPILHEEIITKKEEIEEQMFLGLRKAEGVSKKLFKSKFQINMDVLYNDAIRELKQKKWLVEDDEFVKLTPEGMLFGNEVFSMFLLDEDFE
ncbi:radical SAM family heme chaperone HemW [Salinibacillus xinjiangensis]|uniref:Heme chaperone HemW n=1 Tax=Salinibacillus xinjiangensis TaxID=1229268 RepID=A0A6G1X6Z4_9BACI|nr:radical SAM family heme chaperone HemW [Salinibacillus xinjiangensis]MRG86650.1 oxygen-independent coproporphyrinogen III oxidase [Salinibacillus xinjiangensis]